MNVEEKASGKRDDIKNEREREGRFDRYGDKIKVSHFD